jgi:6-phosphogluconolactonase
MPQATNQKLRSFDSREQASLSLASHTASLLQQVIRETGYATVALTGGSSPMKLYEAWMQQHSTSVDWRNVHFFWGDERNVDHRHEDSNYLLAEPMLNALNVPDANRHVWKTELEPEAALLDMRQTLRDYGLLGLQTFSLVLLGLGEDGHVASLFPQDQPWLEFRNPYPAVARFVSNSPKPPSERYTFTLPMLARAKEIVLLPFGKTKQDVLQQVLAQDPELPASYLAKLDHCRIYTDLQL